MTWICYRGIELSARIQQVLLSFEVADPRDLRGRRASSKVYGSNPPADSIKPLALLVQPLRDAASATWSSRCCSGSSSTGAGTRASRSTRSPRTPTEGPGQARRSSRRSCSCVIYLVVSAGAQSFHGVGFLTNEDNAGRRAQRARQAACSARALDKLLIIAVLTSASASTQTTILPTARTTLSMAHWKAIPQRARASAQALPDADRLDARASARSRSSSRSSLLLISESVLETRVIAIGFPICFYYGFTGIACAWYYRHELFKSVRNFLLLGARAAARRADAVRDRHQGGDLLRPRRQTSNRKPILGITLPLWMGIGGMLLGRRADARLAPLLPRVLRAQDRNRAAGPARRTASSAPRRT